MIDDAGTLRTFLTRKDALAFTRDRPELKLQEEPKIDPFTQLLNDIGEAPF